VVGVPREYFPDSLNPRIAEVVRTPSAGSRRWAPRLREVSLPTTPHAIPTYYIIAPAEASSNLARFDGVRYGVRPPDTAGVKELYERTRRSSALRSNAG
jgi:aspartyl-tRNA(Asn)/glutamyl-tRNA(Gln) amidotransferase subunit A